MKAQLLFLLPVLGFAFLVEFAAANPVVAFSASLSRTVRGLGTAENIHFNTVVTDTHNAYTSRNGTFVVPKAGIYVFTWTIDCTRGKRQETELIVNDQVKMKCKADSYGDHDVSSATNTAVVQASKGEYVCVRTRSCKDDGEIVGHDYSSFSGWLLG